MSTSRGAHGVGANLLRRAGAASKLSVPGWFGAVAVFLTVGVLAAGILGVIAYVITRVVLHGPSDPTNPLAVSYCTRACDVGELLVQGIGCMECVNAFGGGGSTIELSNTLACSSTTGVCSVTKGSGTNLTIASLTGSGLAVVTKSGDVVTVTAELPSDVFPLCAGACAANSVLRLHSGGDCYECVVPLTSCANGDVCGVLSSVGPAVAMNGYVAGSGMTITNTAGGTVFSATSTQVTCANGAVCGVNDGVGPDITLNGYTAEGAISITNGISGTVFSVPDTGLACANGDVCGVLNGTGPSMTMNGYVAGNGVTITNTANGTVFAIPEPVTAGDFVRLPRAGTTYEMSAPWIYENNITLSVAAGGTATLLRLLTRTWWDTTSGDILPVIVNPVPHNNEYNNTIQVELFVVMSITFDGTGQFLAIGNMSGLWIPTAAGMEGYPPDFVTYQFGANACSPGSNLGTSPLATIAMSGLGFSFLSAPVNSPVGPATYSCYLRGVSLYRNGTRPTFNPYDGRFPYA